MVFPNPYNSSAQHASNVYCFNDYAISKTVTWTATSNQISMQSSVQLAVNTVLSTTKTLGYHNGAVATAVFDPNADTLTITGYFGPRITSRSYCY